MAVNNLKKIKNETGASILVMVIAVSVFLLIAAKSVSFSGLDGLDLATHSLERSKSRDLAESCLEEALNTVRNDPEHVSEEASLALPNGNCLISIEQSGEKKIITAKAQNSDHPLAIRVQAAFSAGQLIIESWSIID